VGKITVRHQTDVPLLRVRDFYPPEKLQQLSEGEANSHTRRYFPADRESLQGFEVRLDAHAVIKPHAHTAAEIILVLEGSIVLGATVAEVGAAIYVDDNTLYGFRAGPQGCRFFNFRGDPNTAYVTKEEFMAARTR
jgi:redox-sensitive bicupin YhaK (pirin superfamily)